MFWYDKSSGRKAFLSRHLGVGCSVLLPWDSPHPNFRDREGGLNLVGEFSQVLHPQNGLEFYPPSWGAQLAVLPV